MQNKRGASDASDNNGVAEAFTTARLSARAIDVYPGAVPEGIAQAYAIQDEAISRWPDKIAGWKVGRMNSPYTEAFGCDRLAGPIFAGAIERTYDPIDMPVFSGGFAAVEAECVLILGKDAPLDKTAWTTQEAIDMIGAVAAGIEIASSPFSGINDLGPLVTISDFGNNNGLIVGDELPNWRALSIDDWVFETYIDEHRIGVSAAGAIPGGPVESLRFLLENTARRGRPLKKGMAISSGAVTGVHEIAIGQSARVCFAGIKDISCRIVAAAPSAASLGAAKGKVRA